MQNPFETISLRLNKIETLLEVINKKSNDQLTQNPPKQIFNFEDGCKYLGICKSSGYKLTSSRKIPHSKRGKRIYFEKSELDSWLVANKVKDLNSIENEANHYLTNKKRV